MNASRRINRQTDQVQLHVAPERTDAGAIRLYVGVDQKTASNQIALCRNLETLPNSDKVTAMHQDADFAVIFALCALAYLVRIAQGGVR